MKRRKLILKAKVESGPSYLSFKSAGPGAFNTGFIGSTCTALPGWLRLCAMRTPSPGLGAAAGQGLTLVHFSAQLKRFLCDRGWM